jgi:hypothetical protein
LDLLRLSHPMDPLRLLRPWHPMDLSSLSSLSIL